MFISLRSLSIVAVMSSWSRPGFAESEDWSAGVDSYDCEGPCDGPRTLGGHAFVPSTLVDFPFIVTRVGSTTSVGVAEINLGPSSLVMRLGIDESDDFVFADQSLFANVAITPWLSLAIRGQGSLIVPTGREGGVLVGEQGVYGGNAVAALRLVRSGRLQATALVEGGLLRPNSVVPARLPRSPFRHGELQTIRPGLAVAYAFTPHIGLQASGSYAWQWIDFIEENTFRTLTAGAALTFHVPRMPLTFLLAGQYALTMGENAAMDELEAVFGTGDSNAWGEAGVVYNAIPELDLGAAFDLKLDDIDGDSRWFGQLRIAYYFL